MSKSRGGSRFTSFRRVAIGYVLIEAVLVTGLAINQLRTNKMGEFTMSVVVLVCLWGACWVLVDHHR